ncbi:hypothetical protein BJ912DRAFT_855075, partial [Pholiota molesta]
GPIVLFQAFHDLLKASPLPCFVPNAPMPISSMRGSLELVPSATFNRVPYLLSVLIRATDLGDDR